MGDVIPFARPLGWVLDLDLHGDQVRTVAEVLAWMSRPKRRPTYRLVALRCRIVAACVVSDDVRRELNELAERCAQSLWPPDSVNYVFGIGCKPCARNTPWLGGAGARNRTRDLRFTKPLLYQLSYTGTVVRIIKRKGGRTSRPPF